MNWSLFQNSLLISGGAAFASLLFGVATALWASSLQRRWQLMVLGSAIVAFALPPFLVTNCWLHFLGNAGVWRSWLPLSIYSGWGAAWILALMLWPLSFLAAWTSWQRLEAAHLEADMRLRGFLLFRYLLWPMAQPALGLALALSFVLALNNFSVPTILQIKVFTEEIWLRFSTHFDYVAVLLLGIPLILAPGFLLWFWPRRTIAWTLQGAVVRPSLLRRQMGPALRWLAGGLSVVVILVSVGLPAFQLFASARTWAELPTVFKAEPRLFLQSGILAAIAAFGCVLLGVFAHRSRWRALAWLPLLAPGVVLGVAVIYLLNRPWVEAIYHSLALIILSWTIRYCGLAWNGVGRLMQSVDRDLVDEARLNGARGWSLFRLAYLPQIGIPSAAFWYMTYLLCLWDVETIVLTYPPGGETLALRIFNLLHYGHTAQVNALCLLLLVLAIAPLVLWMIRRAFPAFGRAAIRTGLCLPVFLCLSGCMEQAPFKSRFFSEVQIIGRRGTEMGQFNKPRSVAIDRQDNLYVVDMTGRVQKFSPQGTFLLSWQMPETDLGKPKGMNRDAEGNILVLEPHYQRVNHFTTQGQLVAQWGTKGTNPGSLTIPRSIAVNSKGDIYLSEYTAVDRVQCFSGDGRTFHFAFGHSGVGHGEFNRPEGLGIDRSNRVYVADSCNHRIQVFSAEGKFLRTYGSPGKGLGQLSYPYDVRVDPQGYQYVCEFGNSRIQIFGPDDRPVEILGGMGVAPGEFNNPWAIAFDSKGNLYVADGNNHRVQKFVRKAGA